MRAALWGLVLLLACQQAPKSTTYTGVLEGRSTRVPALLGGRLLEVRVEEGAMVALGDTLALVDTLELSIQARQVEAVREELSVQEEIAATALARTGTDLGYAQEKAGRIRALAEDQALPRQNADDLHHQVELASSARQSAGQQLRVLEAKDKQLLVQLELIRKKEADAVILAPVGGMVASRYFEPGEAVLPMQAVVELLQVRQLEVKIYIPEEQLPQVRYGQQVRLRVDGVSEPLPGQVTWVSERAEFTPKTILTPETRAALVYAVKVLVANPEGVLKHGMPVEVEL
ncbi:MAG: HlyD family efflux transporter periplasmic adaptor subunit [Candidatus Latescibacteria bacterium]|nr:HlyD family efflux transporter periplasmic adaptor subunit [Candidatus Latescibacterota bacterium]